MRRISTNIFKELINLKKTPIKLFITIITLLGYGYAAYKALYPVNFYFIIIFGIQLLFVIYFAIKYYREKAQITLYKNLMSDESGLLSDGSLIVGPIDYIESIKTRKYYNSISMEKVDIEYRISNWTLNTGDININYNFHGKNSNSNVLTGLHFYLCLDLNESLQEVKLNLIDYKNTCEVVKPQINNKSRLVKHLILPFCEGKILPEEKFHIELQTFWKNAMMFNECNFFILDPMNYSKNVGKIELSIVSQIDKPLNILINQLNLNTYQMTEVFNGRTRKTITENLGIVENLYPSKDIVFLVKITSASSRINL